MPVGAAPPSVAAGQVEPVAGGAPVAASSTVPTGGPRSGPSSRPPLTSLRPPPIKLPTYTDSVAMGFGPGPSSMMRVTTAPNLVSASQPRGGVDVGGGAGVVAGVHPYRGPLSSAALDRTGAHHSTGARHSAGAPLTHTNDRAMGGVAAGRYGGSAGSSGSTVGPLPSGPGPPTATHGGAGGENAARTSSHHPRSTAGVEGGHGGDKVGPSGRWSSSAPQLDALVPRNSQQRGGALGLRQGSAARGGYDPVVSNATSGQGNPPWQRPVPLMGQENVSPAHVTRWEAPPAGRRDIEPQSYQPVFVPPHLAPYGGGKYTHGTGGGESSPRRRHKTKTMRNGEVKARRRRLYVTEQQEMKSLAVPQAAMNMWFLAIGGGAVMVVLLAVGDLLVEALWSSANDVHPHVVQLCAIIVGGGWLMLMLVFWLASRGVT